MISIHYKTKDPYALYGIDHFIKKFGIPVTINTPSPISIVYGNIEFDGSFLIHINESELKIEDFQKLILDGIDNIGEYIEYSKNQIYIDFDIFKIIGYILSGKFDLFKDKYNDTLAKIPVVDYYEKKLFEVLADACQRTNTSLVCKAFWPKGKKFAVCLTHDVDEIRKTYQYFTKAIRGLKNRELTRVIYQLKSFVTDKIFKKNPYWTFEDIMKLEDKFNVRSTFFFLKESARISLFDPATWHHYARKYDFREQEVSKIIGELASKGWEVGLHGSYESYIDKKKLENEKKLLESVLGDKVKGIRQHHLNLKIPETWEYQEESGFEYDTSLGFKGGKGVGFRWGTCFPFYPFNGSRIISVLEIPLIIMDISITPDEKGWKKCLDIINTVEEYGGVLTVLWHHTVFNSNEYPGWAEMYEKIIKTCKKKNAWITNAYEIAKWWKERLEYIKQISGQLDGVL